MEKTHEVTVNVMRFMELDSEANRFLIGPKKVREQVVVVCGVTEQTLVQVSTKKRKIEEADVT